MSRTSKPVNPAAQNSLDKMKYEIAKELGNPKLANIVLLGALLEVDKTVSEQAILDAFTKVFGESKAKFIPINKEALAKGAEFVKSQQ